MRPEYRDAGLRYDAGPLRRRNVRPDVERRAERVPGESFRRVLRRRL
jgi:hypothetical protein